MKIAIVTSTYNKEIIDGLLEGAKRGLKESGIAEGDYIVSEVPGSFEIPLRVAQLIDTKKYDGFIALGAVLEGETDHYRAVCDGVTYGLQKIQIKHRVPVMFGVLMCKTKDQAKARSSNDNDNKGYECAKSLIKIVNDASHS